MQKWRKLSTQMTRREARQLLGEPARIELSQTGQQTETWIYEYEVVRGEQSSVTGRITLSASEARVLSWIEPDWQALKA
jgi:hypothetical protein